MGQPNQGIAELTVGPADESAKDIGSTQREKFFFVITLFSSESIHVALLR